MKSTLTLLFLIVTGFAEEPKATPSPEIIKIDARLEELKLIWNQDVAVINRLTNFKRTPVQQGSQAYYQCAESSKRIQQAEAEAGTLKQKRSEILEGNSALEVQKRQLAEERNKLDEERRKFEEAKSASNKGETTKNMVESTQEPGIAGEDEIGIQADRIEPEKRTELGDLSSLRKKLVGYWISVEQVEDPIGYKILDGGKEKDLSENGKLLIKATETLKYNWQCYGPFGSWKSGEWSPYKNVKEEGEFLSIQQDMTHADVQRTFTQRVKILGDDKMQEINEGGTFTYRKISEKEWFERTIGVEWYSEDCVTTIKSNMPSCK